MTRYLYPATITFLLLLGISDLLGMSNPDVAAGESPVGLQDVAPRFESPSGHALVGRSCCDETPPLGRLLETVFSVEAFLYRLAGIPGEPVATPSRPLGNCVNLSDRY